MKILIADDSADKISELTQYFDSFEYDCQIDISMSFKETVSKAGDKFYDLLMLDMTMPTSSNKVRRRGTKARSLAGKDVLATLSYYCVKPPKCIIFSQFSEFGRHDDIASLDEIYHGLLKTYSEFLCGYIVYDSTSDDWKNALKKLIDKEFNK
jgi:CheY-like chemotaxis protein